MIKQFNANRARLKRHLRMRSHMEGSQERPRLSVFRSEYHIYAQIIDDTTGQTLAATSSLEETLRSFKPGMKAAPKNKQRTTAGNEAVKTAAEATPTKDKKTKQAPKAPAKTAQPQ